MTSRETENTERERTALLALLKAGLWECSPNNLNLFPLSATEWKHVFRMAGQQTVTGLTFQGLRWLPDNLLPPQTLLLQWTAETDAIERRNKKMNAALQTLCSSFKEKGLNPILLKGQGIARLYENPLLRECGDIDLYFQSAHDREAALQHIRQMRIQIKEEPDGSAFYVWQGVKVEHHQRLFDLYNPFQQHAIGLLIRQKGFQETGSAPYRLPSPFLNLLLLNLHILKHALGRGIGLRQFCDMARACYKLHGEINREEMKAVCRKLGLGQWNPLLHAFLTDCLGLPAECLPYPEVASTAQPLSDIVWRGGNFGQHNPLYSNTGNKARKWETARSFGRNVGFAFRYAPAEAFWIFTSLIKGQFR